MAELVQWLNQHHLPFGYAQYWTASPVTLLSRGSVRVLPIIDREGRTVPYLWNVRHDWFPTPLDTQHPFFVIVDDPHSSPGPEAFDTMASEAVLGVPTERAIVAGFKVEIYR
jgi:hypothetical protein